MNTNQPENKFEPWRLIFLIPLAAMLTPAIVAICCGVSIGTALLVGIPVGIVAVLLFTFSSGNDLSDLIVSSLIVIVFSVILIPTLLQARKHSLAQRDKAAITRPASNSLR